MPRVPSRPLHTVRLTVVQYAGDFREASERLNQGGAETYRAQRHTVAYIEGLARRLAAVATVAGITQSAYDVVLPSGARAVGAGFGSRFGRWAMLRLVRRTRPDLLVLRAPIHTVMGWAMLCRRPTLVLLADSYDRRTLAGRLKLWVLARLLRSPVFEVVGNHGRRSAQQLVQAGVPAEKVVAWDFPALDTPEARPAKHAARHPALLVFVGMLRADKGVLDLVRAVALLVRAGRPVRADLYGQGDVAAVEAEIRALGVQDQVRLAGTVPNAEVVEQMSQADIVAIPSRHDYPEGLPLTIYEAYCSRTPIVASDHPMFADAIVHERSGLIFPAGRPDALAAQIGRLLDEPALYQRLSEGGLRAWRQMQVPVEWSELIDRWLDGSAESRAWIVQHTQGAGVPDAAAGTTGTAPGLARGAEGRA